MTEMNLYTKNMCDVLEKSAFPEIILDTELNIIFANSEAKKYFGLVSRRDGLKEMLGGINCTTVRNALKTESFFRLESENAVYRIFTFLKFPLQDGNEYISVKIEDRFDFNSRCGKILPTGKFIDVVKDELSVPVSEIYTNILLLKKKFRTDKEILVYLEHLERSVYRLKRGITNLNVMLNAVESVYIDKKEVCCLSSSLKAVADKLPLRIIANNIEYPLTLLDNTVFVKIIMDCMNFLYEQISVPSEKIRAEISDRGIHWCISLKRRCTEIKRKDQMRESPFINPGVFNSKSIEAVKILIESNGGNILISNISKELCVSLSFPKLFSYDMGAMVMDEVDDRISYLIENVYVAEKAYMKELTGE